jgi:hypothetical protein
MSLAPTVALLLIQLVGSEFTYTVLPGDSLTILFEPVLIAHVGDSVFLEVHPDVYKKGIDGLSVALVRARAGAFFDLLDLARVQEVIRKHDGIARDVTRR